MTPGNLGNWNRKTQGRTIEGKSVKGAICATWSHCAVILEQFLEANHICMLMNSCFPGRPMQDTLVRLLWWRKLYTCTEAAPYSSAPILSLSLCVCVFLFIYMPLNHKPVQRASGSSWVCGHNTESATSKLPPSSPQRKRGERRGRKKKREKSGTNSVSHTPQICLCSWKNCRAHLWRCVENPSISAIWPLHSHRSSDFGSHAHLFTALEDLPSCF